MQMPHRTQDTLRSISRSLFGQCRVVYGVSPFLFGKWPSSTAIHDCCPENPHVVLLSPGLCDKVQMLRSIRDYCSANGRCSTRFVNAVRQDRNALQQLRALARKFQMLGSNPRLRISKHEMPRKSSQFMINKSKCHTEPWLESQKVRLSDTRWRGSRKHGCGFV